MDKEATSLMASSIATETTLYKLRLERLKTVAMKVLRELKVRVCETFVSMDDWIGSKFQQEMDAINELMHTVREAIERERKIPHQIVLEGDNFIINFGIMTFEPEPEIRPESPIETKRSNQFTVLQILNLALQLREVAPSGIIRNHEFGETMSKLVAFAVIRN